MNWWAWILLWSNLAGYLFTFRRIAGQLAWYFCAEDRRKWSHLRHKQGPSGDQWFGAIISAALLSLIWPLSLAVAYGISQSRVGIGVFYMPRDERDRIYRERIKELEKQVGVR